MVEVAVKLHQLSCLIEPEQRLAQVGAEEAGRVRDQLTAG